MQRDLNFGACISSTQSQTKDATLSKLYNNSLVNCLLGLITRTDRARWSHSETLSSLLGGKQLKYRLRVSFDCRQQFLHTLLLGELSGNVSAIGIAVQVLVVYPADSNEALTQIDDHLPSPERRGRVVDTGNWLGRLSWLIHTACHCHDQIYGNIREYVVKGVD